MKVMTDNCKETQLVNIFIGELRLPILHSHTSFDEYVWIVRVVVLGSLHMLLLRRLQNALRNVSSLDIHKKNASALWANPDS